MAYGMFLAAMGRANEALDQTKRALERDPVSPATISGVGYVLQMALDITRRKRDTARPSTWTPTSATDAGALAAC